MTFDEKYPNAEVGHEVEPHVFKSKELEHCWECNTLTSYVDNIHFVHLCSHECAEVEWMNKVRILHAQAHPIE